MIRNDLSGIETAAADVTIIGSGPAGITLALECARMGKQVLLLESGGIKASTSVQDLARASITDLGAHDDMLIAVARRFGGTSNLWGGRCQMLDPVDFIKRPGLVDASWPIDREDILPFYQHACRYASCGKPVFSREIEGVHFADTSVDPQRLERFSNSPAFQLAHKEALSSSERLDVRLGATVVDVAMAENGRVERLIVAAADRTRTSVPVKTLVVACGGVESTRLLLTIQRQRTALFGGPDGPLGRYYMGHVIGEIADITFANAKIDKAYDFFLDGNGSYARRRFIPSDAEILGHDLLNCSFWPVIPPVADALHGSSLLSMVYLVFAMGPVGRMVVPEAIRTRHVRPGIPLGPHVKNLVQGLPRAAAYLPSFFYRRYFAQMRLPGFYVRNPSFTYGLSYHQEQVPDPTSRVSLNNETDALGLPRATINFKFARENAEALQRSHELLGVWLAKSGFGTLKYRVPKEEVVDNILGQARHGTHQIGTARMGHDRRSAVVDGNLRAFDSENLYVLTSAVFPTSGQANPTLTIVALAARLADHLQHARAAA